MIFIDNYKECTFFLLVCLVRLLATLGTGPVVVRVLIEDHWEGLSLMCVGVNNQIVDFGAKINKEFSFRYVLIFSR